MRKFLFTLVALFVLTVSAFAQGSVVVTADGDYGDRIKIAGTFQNLNVANQNLPGANVSVDYKLGGFGKWRLGALADFAYHYDTNRALDRYQFLGGTSIAYTIGEDRMSVFGRAMFGATRFDQQSSKLRDFARMTVSAGGGLDINIGRYFVRPLQFDLQYIDERPVRYTRLGAGGGFRF